MGEYEISPPRLCHGLETVLHSPGVHPVKAGIEKLKFPVYLKKVHQPDVVDLSSYPPFVTSSKDEVLHRLALKHGCKFKGSSSSVSPIMSQIYYLFSKFKLNDTSALPTFKKNGIVTANFTPSALKPIVSFLRPSEGIYSIDSLGSSGGKNKILIDLGKTLEVMLTTSQNHFESLLKTTIKDEKLDWNPPAKEAYNYSKFGPILIRAQLDCENPELKKRYFDIKTRALHSIRINMSDYQKYLSTTLENLTGLHGSFEREYYDMIRSAFLKYIIQVKVGRMDGIFVAYHNTLQLFGFEYIPLKEMEKAIFQTEQMADVSFKVMTTLLGKLLDYLTSRFKNEVLKMVMQTSMDSQKMKIFVERIPSEADKGWDSKNSSKISAEYPVHKFELSIEVCVDKIFTKGALLLLDGDNYDIYYRITEIKAKRFEIESEYALYLSNAIDSEEDKEPVTGPIPNPQTKKPGTWKVLNEKAHHHHKLIVNNSNFRRGYSTKETTEPSTTGSAASQNELSTPSYQANPKLYLRVSKPRATYAPMNPLDLPEPNFPKFLYADVFAPELYVYNNQTYVKRTIANRDHFYPDPKTWWTGMPEKLNIFPKYFETILTQSFGSISETTTQALCIIVQHLINTKYTLLDGDTSEHDMKFIPIDLDKIPSVSNYDIGRLIQEGYLMEKNSKVTLLIPPPTSLNKRPTPTNQYISPP
uniref:Uncharacterized protein n=1 Tax=Arcella intermedia TaxID=1963864 RepID=A0A6B2KZ11_9EUKA